MISVPALPVIGPLVLAVIGLSLVRLRRDGRLTGCRFVTVLAATLYGAGVLLVTMFPLHLSLGELAGHAAWTDRLNLVPISTIDAPTFNLNIAMMIPFGVLLPLLAPVRSWSGALRWGALVSFSIESTQFLAAVLFGAGRLADVNDVLANSIGTVFGYAVYLIAAGTPGLDLVLRRCVLWRPAGSSSAPVDVPRDHYVGVG